jgi:hypothetical protein
VVGVGLIGEFGRILEKYVRMSVAALEGFAKHDAHALQYSLIIKSLQSSATAYLEKKERYERLQITESSSQLFGLVPRQQSARKPLSPQAHQPSEDFHSPTNNSSSNNEAATGTTSEASSDPNREFGSSSFFDDLDPAIFSFTHSTSHTPEISVPNGAPHNSDQFFGALNLFPLLEEGGHIDLAHYL